MSNADFIKRTVASRVLGKSNRTLSDFHPVKLITPYRGTNGAVCNKYTMDCYLLKEMELEIEDKEEEDAYIAKT